VPNLNPEKDAAAPAPYNTLKVTREQAVRMVVESAGKTLVLFSGGEMQGEEGIIEKARIGMASGATGLIFGRNVWQRPFNEALGLAREIKQMMSDYGA